ncbi:MAG: hypothetical protein R3250_05805, partial [Melioribacteraceae bacterium]|nr:hypothetical protein [Melioribacteraceae bacterium]
MQDLFLDSQGQKRALNLLSEFHSKNRIPHALLFSGIEGSGKFKTAIQFLKLINEGSDSVLQKIDNLSEPFVKLIMPLPRGKSETNTDDPTSKLTQDTVDDINQQIKLKSQNPYHKITIKNANNIKINSIREINKLVSINFDEIKFRAIILYDAHKMTVEAQNAFLKNLEEPPEGIIYFLITNNPDSLLSTIRSRCWEIEFSPIFENELSEILIENFNLPKDEAKRVVPFSSGSVTR